VNSVSERAASWNVTIAKAKYKPNLTATANTK